MSWSASGWVNHANRKGRKSKGSTPHVVCMVCPDSWLYLSSYNKAHKPCCNQCGTQWGHTKFSSPVYKPPAPTTRKVVWGSGHGKDEQPKPDSRLLEYLATLEGEQAEAFKLSFPELKPKEVKPPTPAQTSHELHQAEVHARKLQVQLEEKQKEVSEAKASWEAAQVEEAELVVELADAQAKHKALLQTATESTTQAKVVPAAEWAALLELAVQVPELLKAMPSLQAKAQDEQPGPADGDGGGGSTNAAAPPATGSDEPMDRDATAADAPKRGLSAEVAKETEGRATKLAKQVSGKQQP